MIWKRMGHAFLTVGHVLSIILGWIGTVLMILGSRLKGGPSVDEQARTLYMPRKEYRP
ncbi:hypothetical protein ACFQ9V_19930 [Leifsonia sp. NPDC056665]|uniref:hypothetical protein n=1 Tax=Leifsonia sp. NPDC056665 TaxID=3345901 RepID=UPI00368D8CEE